MTLPNSNVVKVPRGQFEDGGAMLSLLHAKTTRVTVERLDMIFIEFDTGAGLRLYDDSDNYESFTISSSRGTFIV